MKAKTIKAIIAKKFNTWVESIEDVELKEKVRKGTIVTGGCIASMLLKEKVNDFDLYFRNKEVVKALADYYVARFKVQKKNGIPVDISVLEDGERVKIVVKSAGIASDEGTNKPYQYFESVPGDAGGNYVSDLMDDEGTLQDPGAADDKYEEIKEQVAESPDDKKFRPVFLSTNAITLSGNIQLILRFYGEPEEIHKNYDFVHCTNYWTSWEEKLTLNPAALESLLAKELRYVGSKYPICSMIRLRKFIRRGWTINAGQIVKMAYQVSELDLKDINVLEDQLTGVDVAYFTQLIGALKQKDPEKVNAAYLVEILDRMF